MESGGSMEIIIISIVAKEYSYQTKENTLLSVHTSIDIHITHVQWSVGGLSDHYLLHMTNIKQEIFSCSHSFHSHVESFKVSSLLEEATEVLNYILVINVSMNSKKFPIGLMWLPGPKYLYY